MATSVVVPLKDEQCTWERYLVAMVVELQPASDEPNVFCPYRVVVPPERVGPGRHKRHDGLALSGLRVCLGQPAEQLSTIGWIHVATFSPDDGESVEARLLGQGSQSRWKMLLSCLKRAS